MGLDCESKEVLIQKESIAPFYELIETGNFILAICELDIFVFDYDCKIVWSLGFGDIIEDCKISKDEVIYVKCSNGEESVFDLNQHRLNSSITQLEQMHSGEEALDGKILLH